MATFKSEIIANNLSAITSFTKAVSNPKCAVNIYIFQKTREATANYANIEITQKGTSNVAYILLRRGVAPRIRFRKKTKILQAAVNQAKLKVKDIYLLGGNRPL